MKQFKLFSNLDFQYLLSQCVETNSSLSQEENEVGCFPLEFFSKLGLKQIGNIRELGLEDFTWPTKEEEIYLFSKETDNTISFVLLEECPSSCFSSPTRGLYTIRFSNLYLPQFADYSHYEENLNLLTPKEYFDLNHKISTDEDIDFSYAGQLMDKQGYNMVYERIHLWERIEDNGKVSRITTADLGNCYCSLVDVNIHIS